MIIEVMKLCHHLLCTMVKDKFAKSEILGLATFINGLVITKYWYVAMLSHHGDRNRAE